MFKPVWKSATSELASMMAFLCAFLTSEYIFYILNVSFLSISGAFDPIYFLVKVITILVFYQIWLKFFNWLYS